jgi:asparagine synthase (glutamine-hydrolyzing)
MCGILAIIGNNSGISKQEVDQALTIIDHRGPNDFGLQQLNNAILGFRRLSIIDLSNNGHQPMCDHSGRYWIVFNGEIYNYKAIKDTLIKESISFKSSSDTEVILYGFIRHGKQIVDLLDGMFAFVIYDNISGEVFAARDRMGKKPLLYYESNGRFIFFSELKQILQFSFFERRVNNKALSLFLTYGAIPVPLTIFENVHQVSPGHYALIKDNVLTEYEYWRPQVEINNSISYNDALQVTHDLVTKSVVKRLISDVPLGAFLSGGIDSSIITAIMAKHTGDVKTFSITYADAPSSYDESYYAGLVARRYQTKHSTICITPENVYDDIQKIMWHMDQPSGDAINTYFVSQSARTGVAVSLSGVGADEIFAGYSTFKFAEVLGRLRSPQMEVNEHRSFGDTIFRQLPKFLQVNWKFRILAGVLGAFPTALSRYNLIKEIYSSGLLRRLVKGDLINSSTNDFLKNYFAGKHTNIQQITLAEVNHYLKSTLLRDTDIMGMAKSLEIRCPFIDHELIEFALTVPDEFKIKNMQTKILLKDAFKDYLPDEVINRKKMGFAFPLAAWLKVGKLKALVEDCLSESSVEKRGLFNYREVSKVKEGYFMLKDNSVQTYQFYQQVWLLVVLEMWFRTYID